MLSCGSRMNSQRLKKRPSRMPAGTMVVGLSGLHHCAAGGMSSSAPSWGRMSRTSQSASNPLSCHSDPIAPRTIELAPSAPIR